MILGVLFLILAIIFSVVIQVYFEFKIKLFLVKIILKLFKNDINKITRK